MNDLVNLDLVSGTNISLERTGNEVSVNCTYEYDDTALSGRVTALENGMSDYSLITETGNKIAVSLNTTTYKMTVSLYDKNNNLINTSNEIDLPIESLIINATYDNNTKSLILTLQNGTQITVPIGDLVSGLQAEITSENKLSSDLVDDTNNTNKFVTASEKTNWNNKQNQLVSGTNIKTINSNSILGSGNLTLFDSTNVKTTYNTTSGNVYDVTYINTMIGDIETILTTLDVGSGV